MSKFDDSLNPYEKIVKKTLDKSLLFRVDWEITYRCNLRCSHCYQTGPSPEKELTTPKIFSILDELAALNCLHITFTGGEIFLRKDFFDIAQYARKKEFVIRLFTNGTLIDEETADKIKELNPIAVEMSLYGIEPSAHENITKVPGSYQKTIKAFKLLKQRNVTTVVKCTVMKPNLSEFDKLNDFARNIGSRFIFALTVIPKTDGFQGPTQFRLDEEELKGLFRSHPWIVEGVTKGGIHRYKPLCSAGFNFVYISPYGEVFPCVVLRQTCGNLKELPLKEIWQTAVLKKIRSIKFKDLGRCLKCSFSYYCDRCAGLALLEGKDLLGLSINDCVVAKARKWAVENREQKKILLDA